MLWFTADWHVGGSFKDRGLFTHFRSGDEMIDTLVENTNKSVDKDDRLIIVGDLCDYTPNNPNNWRSGLDIIKEIKCNVELILGNNEIRLMEAEGITYSEFNEMCINSGIKRIMFNQYYHLLNGDVIYVVHRPVHSKKGILNVFAHVHNTGPITGLGYNVTCFCNDFYPVPLTKIMEARNLVNEYLSIDKSSILLSTSGYEGNWL